MEPVERQSRALLSFVDLWMATKKRMEEILFFSPWSVCLFVSLGMPRARVGGTIFESFPAKLKPEGGLG